MRAEAANRRVSVRLAGLEHEAAVATEVRFFFLQMRSSMMNTQYSQRFLGDWGTLWSEVLGMDARSALKDQLRSVSTESLRDFVEEESRTLLLHAARPNRLPTLRRMSRRALALAQIEKHTQ